MTTIDKSTLKDIKLGYASCSIGYDESHTLPVRFDAIRSAGFHAVEISMRDVWPFATQFMGKPVAEDDYDTLCVVAEEVRRMADERGLKIIILQPFLTFEGWPLGSPERADAWNRIRGWARIMKVLGTDLLQIGSTISYDTIPERMVPDLQELSDYFSTLGLRIAYENWCWSAHASTWQQVWKIVQEVNRPNFGLCLDTFQIAGSEWADPRQESGLRDMPAAELAASWRASMAVLASVPKEKIFIFQVSDAYRPSPPIPNHIIDGLTPTGYWSRRFRPVMGEGYLPCTDIVEAVLQTGFRGWYSIEVFDRGSKGQGRVYDLPAFALNAKKSLFRAIEESLARDDARAAAAPKRESAFTAVSRYGVGFILGVGFALSLFPVHV
ncbi:putative 3-dehydroshikimate dehydratase [Peniophora sp. CONT]|nr:putative 3-dehydroshikimate dehydratase [Peniophora sp. CONT]